MDPAIKSQDDMMEKSCNVKLKPSNPAFQAD